MSCSAQDKQQCADWSVFDNVPEIAVGRETGDCRYAAFPNSHRTILRTKYAQ